MLLKMLKTKKKSDIFLCLIKYNFDPENLKCEHTYEIL